MMTVKLFDNQPACVEAHSEAALESAWQVESSVQYTFVHCPCSAWCRRNTASRIYAYLPKKRRNKSN